MAGESGILKYIFQFIIICLIWSIVFGIHAPEKIFASAEPEKTNWGDSDPKTPGEKPGQVNLYIPLVGTVHTDSIQNYLQMMDLSRITETTSVLVNQYGPRHHDFNRIFIDDHCTLGGQPFYNHNLIRSSKYVFHSLEALGYAPLKEWLPDWHGTYNVTATKGGSQYPDVYIEIGAHVDTVATTPGASDNAGAVAAVIEMARVLKDYPNRHSIRFVIYVGEEEYLVGSRYHVDQIAAAGEKIKAALILDGNGWSEDAPQHMNCLWDNGEAETRRLSELFNSARIDYGIDIGWRLCSPDGQWSDNYAYWEHGLPAVLSIGGLPYAEPNYHQCGDNMNSIDMLNVFKTAQENLAVVLKLDAEETRLERLSPVEPILPIPLDEGISH